MKTKLTANEIRWILYDVGNSAFVLLMSTILPIYFNHLAEKGGLSSVNYLAYWGYTASIVTIIICILGPIFGSISDTQGYKKRILLATILIGCIGCVMLGFTQNWLIFLLIFIIAKIGYSGSLIIYDSMLSDITSEDRLDEVSAAGYAWGYIGSCIPFIICLILVLTYDRIGISFGLAMKISFAIVAAWWLITSLPLLKHYEHKHYVKNVDRVVGESFSRILNTFKNVLKNRKVFFFILAFFFYIDGVYTIIDMATAYGSAMGLDSTGLLLALLLTQFVAFPCAIIFGKLSKKYDGNILIKVCILAYLCIAIFAVFLHSQWQFWVLAVVVGMFQGGIQALSRSYYTKIIPVDESGEYFAILDICGKGASFIGTFLVSLIAQLTGSVNLGVGTLVFMFLIGLIFFLMSEK